MFPPHTHFVEPYFGGGAVLFAKPPEWIENHSEVINDIHGELMVFWRVIQQSSGFTEFSRRMLLTPFSKPLWEQADEERSEDAIDRACAFFIRYRQSRQGLGEDFATLSRERTRRGMNEQVSAWLSAVAGLADAHMRLQRVAIYSEDALKVIRREDGKNTLYYCDPPYVSKTRTATKTFAHEMTDAEHSELLKTLSCLEGKFILSGYPSDLYATAEKEYGWKHVEVEIDNKASSKKVKDKKCECLWFNF